MAYCRRVANEGARATGADQARFMGKMVVFSGAATMGKGLSAGASTCLQGIVARSL